MPCRRRTSAPVGRGQRHHDVVVAGDLLDGAAARGDLDQDAREQIVARRFDLETAAARADDRDLGNAALDAAALMPVTTLRMVSFAGAVAATAPPMTLAYAALAANSSPMPNRRSQPRTKPLGRRRPELADFARERILIPGRLAQERGVVDRHGGDRLVLRRLLAAARSTPWRGRSSLRTPPSRPSPR